MSRWNTLAWMLALVTGPVAGPSEAQRPLNLDFERQGVSGPDRAWGWSFGWSAFASGPAATFSLDSSVVHHGRKSLRISHPDSTGSGPWPIVLQVPSAFARGKELKLSA